MTGSLGPEAERGFKLHGKMMITAFAAIVPAGLLLVRHRESILPSAGPLRKVPTPWLWAHLTCTLTAVVLSIVAYIMVRRANGLSDDEEDLVAGYVGIGPDTRTTLPGGLNRVHREFGYMTLSLLWVIVLTGLCLGPVLHLIRRARARVYEAFMVVFRLATGALLLCSTTTIALGLATFTEKFQIDDLSETRGLWIAYGLSLGAAVAIEGIVTVLSLDKEGVPTFGGQTVPLFPDVSAQMPVRRKAHKSNDVVGVEKTRESFGMTVKARPPKGGVKGGVVELAGGGSLESAAL